MINEHTALFIIDMQNDFVSPESPYCVAGAKITVPVIAGLLSQFRDHQLPIFHIYREYRADGSDIEKFRYQKFIEGKKLAVPGTEGCEIVKELTPWAEEYQIVKRRFSGFMNTELDSILRRLKISEILVTGTQYPNCVRATVFDAIALGYDVTVVTDATSAQSETVANANVIDLKNVGVRCVALAELAL
jgi:nicotinamidase-related amidase